MYLNKKDRKKVMILFILSLFIALIMNDSQLFAIPVFLLVLLIYSRPSGANKTDYSQATATHDINGKEPIEGEINTTGEEIAASLNRSKGGSWKDIIKLSIIGLLFGELTELFAVLSNLNLPPEERILFHPDPIIDLVLGFAYYFPLFFVLSILIIKIEINLKELFIIGGIYGILTEQDGGILLSFNIIFWFYVFLVYGSYIAVPYIVYSEKLAMFKRKQLNIIIKIIGSVLVLVLNFLIILKISMAILFIILGLPF
ncbi:MAG: hypothetical protein ACTSU2_02045 [Promethearchaeota archaeon]